VHHRPSSRNSALVGITSAAIGSSCSSVASSGRSPTGPRSNSVLEPTHLQEIPDPELNADGSIYTRDPSRHAA
jgi:hypothetical protein